MTLGSIVATKKRHVDDYSLVNVINDLAELKVSRRLDSQGRSSCYQRWNLQFSGSQAG
jgi:hypothetical protein